MVPVSEKFRLRDRLPVLYDAGSQRQDWKSRGMANHSISIDSYLGSNARHQLRASRFHGTEFKRKEMRERGEPCYIL